MKRRLLIIAIFLLLGAVVNVAVAYSCVFWAPDWPGGSSVALPAGSDWVREPGASWPAPNKGFASSAFGHSIVTRSATTKPGIAYHQTIIQFGWPFRTVDLEGRAVAGRIQLIGVGRRIPATPLFRQTDYYRHVPLRPIWPGFALNTLFYATILWLLAWGAFALRRLVRLRRGLCPKCAYPMGESAVCTECGGALAKHDVA